MTKQVALITGGSSGIGEAAVLELLDAGFTVYAAARRTERMAPLAEKGAHVVALDVTDDASMVACVEQILGEQGRIDVLVNNAGYGSYGAVEDVPIEEARRQFEVNVFGLARLTQLVLPTMREQRSGRIINISSIGARMYGPFGAWYHATKFAVEGLSLSMRVEVAPFGIDVITVAPATIVTEWNTIARNSILENSGSTAYGRYAKRAFKVLEEFDKPPKASRPEAVARKIRQAATDAHPKPVYPAGRGARVIRSSFDLLPYGVTDRMIKLVYRSR